MKSRTNTQSPQPDGFSLMTVRDVARRLKIDPDRLRQEIRIGRLRGYRLGPHGLRLDLVDVQAWLNDNYRVHPSQ